MHKGSSFFYFSIPEIEHAPCLTEMKNYSKLQPLQLYVRQLYVRKRYTVCINILLDLWLGLGIESQGTSSA